MTDLKEIIARAILSAELEALIALGYPIGESSGVVDMSWKFSLPKVEAALKALSDNGLVVVPREATEKMCKAGVVFYHPPEEDDTPFIWKEMIEAYEKEQAQ